MAEKTEAEMAAEKAAADAAAAADDTDLEMGSGDNAGADAAEKVRMAAAIKKANHEAAKYRKQVEAFEAAEAEREAAALTELEKAQKAAADALGQRDAMIAQVEQTTIMHAVEMAAIKLQFIDPTDARMANLDEVTVTDGKAIGVEDALKALLKAKPHLVKQPPKPNIDSQQHNTPKEADEAAKQKTYTRFGVPIYPEG